MIAAGILTVLLLVLIFGRHLMQKYETRLNNMFSQVKDLVSTNDEMKQTLALGLYHRFKKDYEDPEKDEDPLEFEKFVAKIMSDLHNSDTTVSKGSGDFGIDIYEDRNDGQYLGQVKCYAPKNQVPFDPIAIIHSQMINQGAKGGYVITTSSFSDNAKLYTIQLKKLGYNIELINGDKLIDYWVKVLENKKTDYNVLKAEI